MEITYSTLETIEEYEIVFREFYDKYNNYSDLDKNHRLIYLTAGLGLSNSIHEKFIKSIIFEYEDFKNDKLSKNQKQRVISNYKTLQNIEKFVNILNLNLNESFDLRIEEIPRNYSHINSVSNLISIICEQRKIRNDYLHGDFNFSDEIDSEIFKDNILNFQTLHNLLFKMIRESFLNNILDLPNITQIVPIRHKPLCKHCGKEL